MGKAIIYITYASTILDHFGVLGRGFHLCGFDLTSAVPLIIRRFLLLMSMGSLTYGIYGALWESIDLALTQIGIQLYSHEIALQ